MALAFLVSASGGVTAGGSGPGSLDPSFSGDGRRMHRIEGYDPTLEGYDSAVRVLPRGDGSLLAVGLHSSAVAVTKYREDGSTVKSFGEGGSAWGPDHWKLQLTDAVIQDGHIVVSGFVDHPEHSYASGPLLTRFDLQGDHDTHWGYSPTGSMTGEMAATIQGLSPYRSQKLVVAGRRCIPEEDDPSIDYCEGFLARLHPDGSLDSKNDRDPGVHFSQNGWAAMDPRVDEVMDVAVGAKGRIVVVARDSHLEQVHVARFMSDGSLDPSFGTDGLSSVDADGYLFTNVKIVRDRILLGGTTIFTDDSDWAFIALDQLGALDDSFGDGGRILHDLPPDEATEYSQILQHIVVQPEGKPLAVGNITRRNPPDSQSTHTTWGAIVRLKRDGSLDKNFGSGGSRQFRSKHGTSAYGVALDHKRRIVVAGSAKPNPKNSVFLLMRLRSGLPRN